MATDHLPMFERFVTEYARSMRSRALADTTIEDRIEVLHRLQRDLPNGVLAATGKELEEWLSHDSWSRQTKATYYGHIVGPYRWALERGWLAEDPSTVLIRPKVPKGVPRPVSDADLAELLRLAYGPWRTYCLLAAYAGLRCCEIAVITRADMSSTTITVVGKGDKVRTLPQHPLIWEACRRTTGRIGVHTNGGVVNARYISLRTSYFIQRQLRLGPITLHRLRHWYATRLLSEGANLRTVQELLGHDSPATTAIYTLVTDRQKRQAVDRLPDLATPWAAAGFSRPPAGATGPAPAPVAAPAFLAPGAAA